MAPLINFSGIASGIDSSSLIQAILDQQRATRIKPLEVKVSDFTDTNSSLSELKSLLLKFKDTVEGFRTLNGGIISKIASSSDETVATANSSNYATNGSYNLNISQLAKNGTYSLKTSSSTYTSGDDIINSSINNGASAASRTVTVNVGTGTEQETVSLELTNSTTLNDFVTEYNSQSTKSVASIVNVGTSSSADYRIVINSSNEGTEKGQLSLSVGSEITTAGSGAFNSNTLSQATDASLTIGGISGTITRSSNSITDIIPGLTLKLSSTGNATIRIGDDPDSTTSSVQNFVDAYNEIVSFISENDLVTREEDGENVTNIFGALAGTSLDENILDSIRSAFSSSSTSGYTYNTLADFGITSERDGTLKFDATVFKKALEEDPEGARTLTQNLGDTLGGVSGTIASFTQFNGLIDVATNSNNSSISGLNSKIGDIEKSLSEQEKSLIAQYSRLESLIGTLNSQSSALAGLGG